MKSKIDNALISVYKSDYKKSNTKQLYHFVNYFLFENTEPESMLKAELEAKIPNKETKRLIITQFIKNHHNLKKTWNN